MKRRKLFALLVGIDNYAGNIKSLSGAKNDVKDVDNYLKEFCGHFDLFIRVLTDEQAKRDAIITGFREFLCRAEIEDVALFHFSGHGSRVPCPREFNDYDPGGYQEAIVCYDSRSEGKYDLADKELAVLFSEVGRHRPHILAVMDCCHSGSGIRRIREENLGKIRFARENPNIRPIESYLEGYFKRNPTKVEEPPMVLMAACENREKAGENNKNRGIFSYSLYHILRESEPGLSYTDIFLRTRNYLNKQTQSQHPRLECLGKFNPHQVFLDGSPSKQDHAYRVFFKNDAWYINCGSTQGIPMDPLEETRFTIYKSSNRKNGRKMEDIQARGVHVDLQDTRIEFCSPHELNINKDYQADLVSIPTSKLEVNIKGNRAGKNNLIEFMKKQKRQQISFIEQEMPTRYLVNCLEQGYQLIEAGNYRILFSTRQDPMPILNRLERIERWERILRLSNSSSQLKRSKVNFFLSTFDSEGNEQIHKGNKIQLKYGSKERDRGGIPFQLKASHHECESRYLTLLYLSPDYGIHSLAPCTYIHENPVALVLHKNHLIKIPSREYHRTMEIFLLLVSTHSIDEHLFIQADMEFEYDLRDTLKKEKIKGDWYEKFIAVETVWSDE